MSKTIVEQMVAKIAGDIFRGEYEPGDRLPPYRRLAESFDVTLPTAQRAVGRIHELGLVTVRQGSGATVLDPATHASPAVLGYWVGAVRDQPERARQIVEDFLEVRRELATSLVVRLSMADEEGLEHVEDAVSAFADAVASGASAEDYREADLAVIRAIIRARPSIALGTIFNSFVELLRAIPELTRAMYSNPALNVAGYRSAIRMVRGGTPEETIRDAVQTTMRPLDQTTARKFEAELRGETS